MKAFFSSHKNTRPPSYQKQRSVCLPTSSPIATLTATQIENNDNVNNNNRLSWPQFRNVNQTQHSPNVTTTTTTTTTPTKGYVLRGRDEQPNSYYKFRRDTAHTPLERVLPKDEANVMERANQIVMYVTPVSPTSII